MALENFKTDQVDHNHIFWHEGRISRQVRERILGQQGVVIWFTGLSGSGKSTLANAVAENLNAQGRLTYTLDGDNLRHGLNKDLGFSVADRQENIRRTGEVARLLVDAGLIVLAAFISPLREDRAQLRQLLGKDYIEVFVDCDLAVCEARDPKNLYRKARAGEIKEFTGISSPYEKPENPELVVHTDQESLAECANRVLNYLAHNLNRGNA
ncbi:adenylyl-sulfate kinase [Paradesulfitobacterium aromaticivorans]